MRRLLALLCLLSLASAQAVLQLSVYYSDALLDNDVCASDDEVAQALSQGYKLSPPGNGHVFASEQPGTVPLLRFHRSNSSADGPVVSSLLVATQAGIDYANTHGYSFVRVDGYVYADNSTCKEACPALEQWYSAERQDVFLVGQSKHRQDAISAGYVLVRVEGYQAPAPPPPAAGWQVWPSEPPSSSPFPPSRDILNFSFDNGNQAQYGNADTWYPSWAMNGKLYTPWTDGCVMDNVTHTHVCSRSPGRGPGENSTTGFAVISGDDIFNLTVTRVGTFASSTYPYQGRYPSASFYYRGTWYYGTYALNNSQIPPDPAPDCGNWCVQGPFVGFRYSTDEGATWTEPRMNMTSATDNLFGETASDNTKVKFGAPHVVDLGRELEFSPDGKMYIIAHGAQRAEAHESWMQGDQVYMARAAPTLACITDRLCWEFFAGFDATTHQPTWAQGNVSLAQPLFTWENHTGVVTLTYLPPLRKYIMVVSTPTYSPYTVQQFDTYMLEADDITGPFRMVTYMTKFGQEAYFVHVPSKFLGNVTRTPQGVALVGVLSYSANFAYPGLQMPFRSGYYWCLQPMRLLLNASFAAGL